MVKSYKLFIYFSCRSAWWDRNKYTF